MEVLQGDNFRQFRHLVLLAKILLHKFFALWQRPLPYWRKFISAIQRYLGLAKFLFSENIQLYGTIRSTWYNF